jgi:hypothetical protein
MTGKSEWWRAGETSGEPFLIADLLARARGGVGVVLEHRPRCVLQVCFVYSDSSGALLRAWCSFGGIVQYIGLSGQSIGVRTCRRTLSGARIILRIAFT